jgi:hypothetical protein
MNPFAPPPSPDVAERIAQVIWLLCQTVAERCRGPRVPTLTLAQVTYICGRLLAARKRFRRVVALIRAGKPPKIRARKPPKPKPVKPKRKTLAEIEREAEIDSRIPLPRGWRRWAREDRVLARAAEKAEKAARALAAAEKPVPLWRALGQHRFGWLRGLVPQIFDHRCSAGTWANELRRLLAEPEVQGLLMAHPYVGESLREVCWALHIEGSLLHPSPKLQADPAVAPPGFSVPAPVETVLATPPQAAPASAAPVSAAMPTPDERKHFSGAVPVPPPPLGVAGDMPSPQGFADVPSKGDFFAPG